MQISGINHNIKTLDSEWIHTSHRRDEGEVKEGGQSTSTNALCDKNYARVSNPWITSPYYDSSFTDVHHLITT